VAEQLIAASVLTLSSSALLVQASKMREFRLFASCCSAAVSVAALVVVFVVGDCVTVFVDPPTVSMITVGVCPVPPPGAAVDTDTPPGATVVTDPPPAATVEPDAVVDRVPVGGTEAEGLAEDTVTSGVLVRPSAAGRSEADRW